MERGRLLGDVHLTAVVVGCVVVVGHRALFDQTLGRVLHQPALRLKASASTGRG